MSNPEKSIIIDGVKASMTHSGMGTRRDLMDGADRWEYKVHNHGFVALIDVMPRLVSQGQTADDAIVQAARVSYQKGTAKIESNEGLIRYLLRHRHTTPFEMVEFKFDCKMPIFVARQWIRHRTASVNELSGRYSVIPSEFYRPDLAGVRKQSKTNKQGSAPDGPIDDMTAQEFLNYLEHIEGHYKDYEKFADAGVAREMARMALPVSIYTQWIWKIDLHNLMHFLGLRMDAHAQQEIQDYANPMYQLIKAMAPMAVAAFDDYHPMRGAITLSGPEVEWINRGMRPDSIKPKSREEKEFETKLYRLGFKPHVAGELATIDLFMRNLAAVRNEMPDWEKTKATLGIS